MSRNPHGIDDVLSSPIQVHQNVAGVSIAGIGLEEYVISLAIAQTQKSDHGPPRELHGAPNVFSGKGPAARAMNQPNPIQVAGHGGQLSAQGLHSEEETPIHGRDSNMHSGHCRSKPEVLTLRKTGSFHFALT
jgi:hypothetical protein